MNQAGLEVPYMTRNGSDWEIVSKISSEFDRHYQVKYKDIQRMAHNFRGYQGLDGGLWEDKDLQKLSLEDRTAYIFNLARNKVDTLTGTMMSEKNDLDWQPLDKRNAKASQLVKDLYDIDKELWDYDFHFGLATRDGNVMSGELEIAIDRSKNGLPYIRFIRGDSAYIVRDSDWLSDDEEDCESAFKVAFLSPLQLQRIFKAKGPIIETAVDRIKRFGKTPEMGSNPFEQVSREIKGDTYRTIIHYWIDHQEVENLYGRPIGEFSRIVFPRGLEKEQLEKFMVENRIDPYTLRAYKFPQKVNMCTTICPSLVGDALLGNGRSEIQIGRLPLFHFTNMRVEGRDIGIVDMIKHVNQLIQKDESKISDIISSAQGGALAANWDAFKFPSDRARLEKGANDPSTVVFMDGDEMRKGQVFQRLEPARSGPEMIQRIQRMYDVVDRVSGIPSVMESMTESKQESGKLFDSKNATSRIALTLQYKYNALMQNRMGEAYINQIRPTYSGPTREFISKDGKKSVVLNQRVARDNKIYIKNSPIMLPRCAVFVTESNQSLNRQTALRGILFGLFEKVAGTHPEFASLMIREIIRTVSIGDPKVEARMDAITEMQEIRDFAKFKADITGLEAGTQNAILQIMQAKMQTMQIMAQEGAVPQTEEDAGMEVEQGQLDQQAGTPAPIEQSQPQEQPA